MATTSTQLHFRFRNDDGSESSATWKAAEDTNITLQKGANRLFRLRILMDVNGAPGTPLTYVLRFSKNAGAYADVGASTNGVKLASTGSGYSDHDATTHQETAPGNGDVFAAGTIQSNDATTSTLSYSNQYTELEWMMQTVDADITATDTFDFRIYVTGPTVLEAYTVTPRITMIAGGNTTYLPLLGVG